MTLEDARVEASRAATSQTSRFLKLQTRSESSRHPSNPSISYSKSRRLLQVTHSSNLAELTGRYNRLVGSCKKLVHRLSLLDPTDPYRLLHEQRLQDKLYAIGVINSTVKVSDIENKLSVSAFCRRRIAVVMARLKMCETVSAGVKMVEQGHVRVGPEVITDPAYLVPRYEYPRVRADYRNLEDFVTWVDSSKIKKHIVRYSDKVLPILLHGN